MGSSKKKSQKPPPSYRLGSPPVREHSLKFFVSRSRCGWAERCGAAAQMKARRSGEPFGCRIEKIKPLSAVNMQIDEPGRQVKVLRIDPFGRGNSIITSNFRDGTR